MPQGVARIGDMTWQVIGSVAPACDQ